MAINLAKNKAELLAAWNEVAKPGSDNDWALFGYDGKSFDLKVIEKGDGGLEELGDEMSSGKILYGVCRVKDPNTSLPKIVFINWQGEGVPATTKGKCANHLRDIQGLFKGAHVTVNARSDDDIDPDVILDKVKSSSGSNYSIHKEKAKAPEPFQPVGTNYKRATPIKDITTSERDSFWTKQEEEEKQRVIDEAERRKKDSAAENARRKKQEAQDTAARDAAFKERSRSIDQQRAEQRKLDQGGRMEEEKRRYEQTLREAERDDSEFRSRSDSSRTKRLQEAHQLIKQRSLSSGDDHAHDEPPQPAKKQPPTVAKKSKPKVDVPQRTEAPAPAVKAKKTPLLPPVKKTVKPLPKIEPQPVLEPEPEPEPVRKPEPVPEPEPIRKPEPVPEPEPIRKPEPVPEPEPVRKPEPVRHAAADETPEEESSWQDEEEEDTHPQEQDNIYDIVSDEQPPKSPEQPSVPYSMPHQDGDIEETQDCLCERQQAQAQVNYETIENYEEVKDDGSSHAQDQASDGIYDTIEPTETAATAGQVSGDGLTAKVLYDYQAVDDSELTIDVDEIITEIEQIDAGWWRGRGPSGSVGLFPANYVEVVEGHIQCDSAAPETTPSSDGLSARALYDYQAADASEITFDPDDVISQIEQIDEGWWRGRDPSGHVGLFPANYVELL